MVTALQQTVKVPNIFDQPEIAGAVDAYKTRIKDIEERSKKIAVNNQENYDQAAEVAKHARGLTKEIKGQTDPIVKALYDAHRTAKSNVDQILSPLDEVTKTLTQRMNTWQIAEQRRRQEEQRIIAERARKEAEENAKRLRVEAEAKAKAQQEALLQRAQEAEDKGDAEAAELAASQAAAVQAEEVKPVIAIPIIQTEIDKPKGVVNRTDIVVTVVDSLALIKAIANGTLKIDIDQIVIWKTGALKTLCKTTGVREIPGCTVEETSSISVRA